MKNSTAQSLQFINELWPMGCGMEAESPERSEGLQQTAR